jgi:glutamate transport system permease protein
MGRTLEDVLYGQPGRGAPTMARAASVVAAVMLVGLAVLVVRRFEAAGQLAPRYWSFFAQATTWTFLGKGLLGTMASAAMAALIALTFGLVLLVGRLSRARWIRWPSVALIEFLRGTPTLLLIYACFLVLPSVGIKLSTYWT